MNWVPLTEYETGINLEDKPRRLTRDEIVYIANHMPLAPSADPDAAEVARKGIIDWITASLSDVELCPSAAPELIQRMVETHYKSLVAPGTPIGINAAEAVGATTTQMTLNSVAPHERILIQDKQGNGHLLKIGDWIDELLKKQSDKVQHIPENRTQYLELEHPVTIATSDENGKVTWEEITAVTKHLPVGDLVKITSKSGRDVTVTQSKSLLIWDGTKLVPVEGKQVKIGDQVPIFAQLPEPSTVVDELDLRKYLPPSQWLYISELEILKNKYDASLEKENFWDDKSLVHNLPYNGKCSYKAITDVLETGLFKPGHVYHRNWRREINTSIPERIPLTKEFGLVVGLYLAEGLSFHTSITIGNNDVEYQNLSAIVCKWCDNIGIEYDIRVADLHSCVDTTVNIYSTLLAQLFTRWLHPESGKRMMPIEVLFGNKEFIIGVLDGYFSQQGTIDEERQCLSVLFPSKEIATGFGILCSRLGIFGKQSGRRRKRDRHGKITHFETYIIRGPNIIHWKNLIGSSHYAKAEKLSSFTDDMVSEVRHNGVILDPITKLEFVPATEYVYDVTVPSTKNFSLWNGLVVRDTFHTSGSAKSASFGIDSMRDIIFARKNPKNEACTIYFTNKQATYEEVLNSRHYIVGSVVSDFILKENGTMKYDIDHPDTLQRYWWHEHVETLLEKTIPPSTKVLRLFLNVTEMYKHHVTIKELADVLEREVPPSVVAVYGPMSDGIIDLYPHPTIIADTLKGREKGIIPLELAELTYLESIVRPELNNIRVKGISGLRNLIPIVSPVWRIVLQERKLTNNDIYDEAARGMLSPYINDGTGWILFYNLDTMKRTGLVAENLAALCQLAGITIVGGTQVWLAISMPNDRFRTGSGDVVIDVNGIKYRRLEEVVRQDGTIWRKLPAKADLVEEIDKDVKVHHDPDTLWRVEDNVYVLVPEERYLEIDGISYEQIDPRVRITEMKPSEYVTEKVTADKRARHAEIKRLSDEVLQEAQQLPEGQRERVLKRPVTVPRTPLMIASEFIIAEVEGSNLKELLALPNVDKTRTTCNNMYTITNTLGAEAARTFVIRALRDTISNTGSYVHPANIMFIAEFIMSRGEPYGATYTGISRQPGGHLSLATLERAGEVFAQNALHGRKEDIRNVSASVAVGARMALGDGSFDVAQDIIENGVPKTVINDDLFTALDRDDDTVARKAVPTQALQKDDLEGGLDLIKTITLGGTFDHIGAEDETNLLTLFNQEDVIPDLTTTRQVTTRAEKVVRRVQAPAVIDVPRELVDVLAQIKIGVPLPEGEEALAIKPVTIQEVVVPEPIPEPIVSTGLVPLPDLIPQADLPQQLEMLFREYNAEQTVEAQDLPRADIPELPALTEGALATTLGEMRREQMQGLQPINIAELQTALQ